MKRIKVRFNLGKGANYMKWKVEYTDGKVEYYHPTDVQIVMRNCELRNYKKTAEKIFNGANKTVCAWVLCEDISIRKTDFVQLDLFCDRIRYNPKVQPNWILNGAIADNTKIDLIGTVDYGLYRVR